MSNVVKGDACNAPQVESILQEVQQLSVALSALERRLEMILSTLEEHAPAKNTSAPHTLISSAIAEDECDDFTLIRGIDKSAAEILHDLGLTHYRDIAAFTPEDVEEIGKAIGDADRLSGENWIEQAALLAKGIETAYSREQKRSFPRAATATSIFAAALSTGTHLPAIATQLDKPKFGVSAETSLAEKKVAADVVNDPPSKVVSLLQYRLRRQTIISQTIGWSAAAASIALVIGIVFGLGNIGPSNAMQFLSNITEVTEATSQGIAQATDD